MAGSVHERAEDALLLRASVNIPAKVAEITARIPRGKGMAGLAWERDQCVATCNLKGDRTGDVRPGARAVDARGAIAIPVRSAGGDLRAVVGVAFPDERDFDEEALKRFEEAAATLPEIDARP
ncbi:MAG TPA: GAF domain-containing protein [Polyangiaceae bacterium]